MQSIKLTVDCFNYCFGIFLSAFSNLSDYMLLLLLLFRSDFDFDYHFCYCYCFYSMVLFRISFVSIWGRLGLGSFYCYSSYERGYWLYPIYFGKNGLQYLRGLLISLSNSRKVFTRNCRFSATV